MERKKRITSKKPMIIAIVAVCLAAAILATGCTGSAGTKFKNLAVGDTVSFGTYEQDNNTANGKEEIQWRVLAKEGDKLLVISEYGLDAKPYNTEQANVTWETCSLRKWLNEHFLSAAFSDSERKCIETGKASADKNPEYSTEPGNATEDQVFLLSVEEAKKYITSDEEGKCIPTDYAKAQGAWTSGDHTKGGKATCWWWLRSPGQTQNAAAGFHSDGSLCYDGLFVNDNVDCVRPALWVKP